MKKFIKSYLMAVSLIILGSTAVSGQNNHATANETNGAEGITELLVNTDLAIVSNIYPNPSAQYVNFRFYGKEDAVLYVRILNDMGLLAQDKVIVSPSYDESYQLETSDLPAGVYTLSFRQGKNVINQKLQILK